MQTACVGTSQFWLQRDELLFINFGHSIAAYDLATESYTDQWNDVIVPDNTWGGGCCGGEIKGCFAATDTHFIITGKEWGNGVQTLNLANLEWDNFLRDMTTFRSEHSCMYIKETNSLYAIASARYGSNLNTAEKVVVVEGEYWHIIDGTLSTCNGRTRAVLFSDFIYVLGCADSVYSINIFTDEILALSDSMLVTATGGAAINVDNTIFYFGGFAGCPVPGFCTATSTIQRYQMLSKQRSIILHRQLDQFTAQPNHQHRHHRYHHLNLHHQLHHTAQPKIRLLIPPPILPLIQLLIQHKVRPTLQHRDRLSHQLLRHQQSLNCLRNMQTMNPQNMSITFFMAY